MQIDSTICAIIAKSSRKKEQFEHRKYNDQPINIRGYCSLLRSHRCLSLFKNVILGTIFVDVKHTYHAIKLDTTGIN